jgi:hypothetical protein
MIGFIWTFLQLQSIITAHNQWLSKNRSIPYWTTSVFSSAVTDLVMIYESVTSSTATACEWLPYECRMTAHSRTELTSRRTQITISYSSSVISLSWKHVLASRCLSMDFRFCSLMRELVFGKQLASNGLPFWLHYSGFQASCHNMFLHLSNFLRR